MKIAEGDIDIKLGNIEFQTLKGECDVDSRVLRKQKLTMLCKYKDSKKR